MSPGLTTATHETTVPSEPVTTNNANQNVLLATMQVRLLISSGHPTQNVRALADNGSQLNLISLDYNV